MKFFINGEELETTKWNNKKISYKNIVFLAGKRGNQTVTFRGKECGDGFLRPGEDIKFEDGMRFDVTYTGAA